MNERRVNSVFSRKLLQAITASFLIIIVATQTSWGNSTTLESALRSDPAFSLFTKAMDTTDFWDLLAKEDSVTLFVPTNLAMEREGSDFLLRSVLTSTENKGRLKDLISSHFTINPIHTNNSSNTYVRTLSQSCLSITQIGNAMKVGPEAFVISKMVVGNHRLFVIDRLLVPDYLDSGKCSALPATGEVF